MIDHAAIHGLGPAAGRRPLTGDVPAALTAIGGIPLLGHALDRLAAQGVRRAVLCAHHHRAALAAYLAGRATGPDAEILAEAEPLGSAAALAAAAARLGDAPFYAVAADQIWFDGFRPALARLAAKWDDARMDALLLVHPVARAIGYDGRGDIFLDPTGRARPRVGGEIASHAACGVAVLHPRALTGVAGPGDDLADVIATAAGRGRLYAVVHDGEWSRAPDAEAALALEVAIGYRPVPATEAERLVPRPGFAAADPAAFAAAPARRRMLRPGARRPL
jgi:N-acetyl-alpha-D-muramate 1-phosphate uridylyltransferase